MSAEAAVQDMPETEEQKENPKSGAEHPTFLDVINGTGELSVKDQNLQKSLPPKPTIDLLMQPYQQM